MDFGMLWFDNNPASSLSQKAELAAAYYRSKYGTAPTICLVNPKMMKDQEANACSVSIKPDPIVLLNHLWLGSPSEADRRKD